MTDKLTDGKENQNFEAALQATLRDSEQSLDGKNLQDLAFARQKALKQLQYSEDDISVTFKRNLTKPQALAACLVVATSLALLISTQSPELENMPLVYSDIQTNTASISPQGNDVGVIQEELDLYEDLEFYQWLAETEFSG